MSDWTSGYVADIGYTYGYYQELNPARIKLAFLNAGLVPPKCGTACELGFGQGVSVNIHAAASDASWYGTDFNPAQAGFAQELATVSGADAQLFDESFEEFCSRDLPEFDFIGLHGIWSWISDENRLAITEFIRKRLKVGGVLYVSYNTLPGWSNFSPIRHLLTEHAQTMGSEGAGIVGRIDGALEFVEKFIEAAPLAATATPQIKNKIQQIKGQNKQYLAHEYFNRDWQPMYFSAMAKYMESAKLTYACSASYFENIDQVNLTAEQQKFISEINDPTLKHTVRDFMINQQFRKDYWVKGSRSLNEHEQIQCLLEQRFVMTKNKQDVVLKVKGHRGESTLSEVVYRPIIELMSDYKFRSAWQIQSEISGASINSRQLMQALLILCDNGVLSVTQDDKTIKETREYTDRLNLHIMKKALTSNELKFLASPVTGGGFGIGRFQQIILLAIKKGIEKPKQWAEFMSDILNSQNQKMIKDGKTIGTQDEQMEELLSIANEFELKYLNILRVLQII